MAKSTRKERKRQNTLMHELNIKQQQSSKHRVLNKRATSNKVVEEVVEIPLPPIEEIQEQPVKKAKKKRRRAKKKDAAKVETVIVETVSKDKSDYISSKNPNQELLNENQRQLVLLEADYYPKVHSVIRKIIVLIISCVLILTGINLNNQINEVRITQYYIDVPIYINGQQVEIADAIYKNGSGVTDYLEEHGYDLNIYSLKSASNEGVYLRKDVSYYISYAGTGWDNYKFICDEYTLSEVLKATKLDFDASDKLYVNDVFIENINYVSTILNENDRIYIELNSIKIVEEAFIIPYTTKRVPNDTMYEGSETVSQQGVNGVSRIRYKVTYVNGVAVSKEYFDTIVVEPMREEIIQVGTKKKESTPSNGA